MDRRLALAFSNPDPAKGLDAAKAPAAELRLEHPDAASLLEGLDDMFAVRRLGVKGSLAEVLTCTNCIESMISGCPHHHAQHEALAGRPDEKTLGGGRHARSPALFPAHPRLQTNAHSCSCPPPPRRRTGHT